MPRVLDQFQYTTIMRFQTQFWILLLLFFIEEQQGVKGSHELFNGVVEHSKVDNRYKPVYHFRPPKNWMNDPNAPMYFNGVYHFLYQYNPRGAVWGNIVWAHAVSVDLVNWKIIEPAIYSTKSFDINGCWSGSATILHGKVPAILYTGVDSRRRQVQNIVFPRNVSDPYLRRWYKPDYNPVIRPVDGINATSFRDPTTGWRGSDGKWRTIVGSQDGRMGTVILYRSHDFIHWKRASRSLHSVKNTGMWECPDFFPVLSRGKRGVDHHHTPVKNYVLKVSLDDTRFDYYTIGKYYEGSDVYIPNPNSIDNASGLRYDYGSFYASKSFYDERKQRRVLWSWVNETDLISDDIAKGWAGIQTIPRTLWLDKSGKQLVQWPVEEIESLRGRKTEIKHLKLKQGSLFEVKGVRASQVDVEVVFKVSGLEKAEPFDHSWLSDPEKLCTQKAASATGKVGPFGLLVLASTNLTEYTAVFFRVFKYPNGKYTTLMCSDATRSSLRSELYQRSFGGFVDIDIEKSRKISLRSLIDRSVVESFGAKGRTCITSRVYPTLLSKSKAKVHLFTFNYGSEIVKISNLKAWEMRKASIVQAV